MGCMLEGLDWNKESSQVWGIVGSQGRNHKAATRAATYSHLYVGL